MDQPGNASRDRLEQANLLIVRRYFEEILNRGAFAVANALLAPTVVFRNPPVLTHGPKEFTDAIRSVRAAFHDLHFAIEDEITEADKVAIRWRVSGTQTGSFLGHPPSGRRIDVTGMNIFQLADGHIQEIWVNMDRRREAEQLGWADQLS
jgi:steroid delta-isomerase-like uncharacterized protein